MKVICMFLGKTARMLTSDRFWSKMEFTLAVAIFVCTLVCAISHIVAGVGASAVFADMLFVLMGWCLVQTVVCSRGK